MVGAGKGVGLMVVAVTEEGFISGLCAIRGVKSASLFPVRAYAIGVVVRYSLWTYLVPFANRRAAKRVHDFIYGERPFSISMSVNGGDAL